MSASFFTRRSIRVAPLSRVILITLLLVSLFSFDPPNGNTTPRGAAQTVPLIVAVSAASFQNNRAIAPNSIVAAFTGGVLPPGTFLVGNDTIPGTPIIDLPTLLGNFSVEIHGRSAGIFAMLSTPGFDQINLLVPPDLEPGRGPIVIKNGAGQIVAAGEIEVGTVTPAVFTANSNGGGVPSALIYRYRSGILIGVEDAFQLNVQSGAYVPRPIDLGPPEDELFLVMFLTGIRKVASANATRVIIGGEELTPIFVGDQGSFAGLDQVNIKLSRTLRGRLTLAFTAIGFGTSNLCEIEIAPPTNSPPSVNALSKAESLAGELVDITGTGFSTDSEVVISDANNKLFTAQVVEARSTSLRVRVPYGAGTGNVVVRNSRGEASFPFKMRTSLSGIVQIAQRQQDGSSLRIGVPQATIKLVGYNNPPIQTNADGSFLMPDVPPTSPLSSGLVFEVDGTTNPALGLAKEIRRIRVVTSGRDNPFPEYIELKPESAQSVPTIAGALPTGQFAVAAQSTPNESEVVGQTGQVIFEPNGSTVQLPGGQPVNALKVTVLDTGRTPSDLPFGQYSSTIVQLSPFGASIQPGGRLIFPNTDNLPANKVVTLYRFDQTPNSNTIGQFVTAGTATVTADGQRIQTPSTAVFESTYYFVSDTYPTTTLYGRVIEEDNTPARGALVQVSGQSIFSLTDDNGSFFLLNVPIVGSLPIAVEVSYLRPDGTVDRAQRTGLQAGAGGLTYVSPPIKLPGQGLSRVPLIVAPKNLSIEAGKASDFSFLAYARVAGLTLNPIGVSGAPFASVISLGNDRYTLHLAPAAAAAGNSFTIVLTATDSQNQTGTASVAVEVKAASGNAPTATSQSVLTNEDTHVNITLAGTGGNIFRIVNQPLRGRLEGTAPNVSYHPDQDFNGSDTFSFAVSNGTVESAPAIVSIAVQPVPDQPQLEVGSVFSTNIGQKLAFVISGRDGDGQTLTLNSTGLPSGATIKQATATSWLFEWTPTATQIGAYTLNLTLSDNGAPAQNAVASVAITVDAKWARSPGIDGGLIQCFLVSGNAILAGTDFGGVFRSTDNGASWAPSGLSQTDVQGLLSAGGSIFAATGRGVYRSTDNAASWIEVSTGLPQQFGEYRAVLSIAVSGTTLFAGTTAGVYRSSDNGGTWTPANNGIPNKELEAIPVNVLSLLVSGGNIFAGTSRSVYRSGDNGASWSAANSGLPGGPVPALIASGSTLFVSDFGNGVYRSTNNGTSWTAANSGLTEPFVRSLLISGNTLYAGTDSSGMFASTDNGNTWNERGLQSSTIYSLISAAGGTILAGGYNSVYRTADGGTNWIKTNSGLSNLWIYSVVVAGNSIFTGTDDGVYRSTDNGSSWVRVGLKDKVVSYVGSAGSAIIASNGGLTYRSTDNGASWNEISSSFDFGQVYEVVNVGSAQLASSDTGLFRSTNDGATWTAFGANLPTSSGFVVPLDGLAVSGQFVFVGTFRDGIYRSNDGGANWVQASNGLPTIAANEYFNVPFISAANNVIFAGYASGLFRSTDNGATWSAANNGLQQASVNSVAFSGNAFYAGTFNKGVFRSTDNGATWTPSGLSGFRDVFSIATSGTTLFAGTTEGAFVLAEAALAWTESNNGLANRFINAAIFDTNSFLLGTNDGGVYRSSDDGKNWQPANSGLPPAGNVRALIKTAGGAYAGVPGSGVYFSSNQGTSWVARNSGLTNLQVNALAVDGTTLFAGTEGGVFRSTDGGASWNAVNTGLTRLRVLSLTAGAGGTLAGTDLGLFRFNSASSSWTASNTGLGDLYVLSLGTAPNGTSLLAGTSAGLFISTNQGQNWSRVDRGISERVVALSLVAAGNKMLAGTVNGFYISDDNGNSWGVNNTGLINPQVSALATRNNLVVAGTRNSGVFLSQIPDAIPNHPPAIAFSCQPALTTSVGQAVTCTITRTDPDGGQQTTLSAGGLLSGAQFNSGSGAFSWTPTAMQSGIHAVTFTATDSGNPRLASSRELTITVNSPVPQLTSLSPNSRPAASGAFNITVNGSGFVQDARVRWNGANRTTQYISATQLAVQINATDIAAPGNASITVFNPAPAGGISNAQNFTITAACNYAINPGSRSINAAGGTGSITLTTGAGCPWTTATNVGWLSVTSASSGSGSTTINYSVQPNLLLQTRSGTITVGGQTFTVNQGAGAEITLDDGGFEQVLGVQNGGTAGALNRLTPATYPATLYGISIRLPSGQNIANGKPFTLLFGSATSAQDTNSAAANLQTLNATAQSVANFAVYTIPELTINSGDFLVGYRMTHAAGEGPISNDTSSGSNHRSFYQANASAWTAIDTFPGFAGNFGIRARTSVGCTPGIGATSQNFVSAGGTGSIPVNNAGGCTWSAASYASWITVTSGSSGTGNGNANYAVQVNLSTAPRTGTLVIAGRTFTVTQEAGQSELAVDDGSADTGIGLTNGGTLSVVNRFTPPVYPLTVNAISFQLQDGIAAGRAVTLLIGTVSSGAANLNGLSFQEVATTTQAAGAFRNYTIPDRVINSGDIVLGYRLQHVAGEFPASIDRTTQKKRSYLFNGANHVPIGDLSAALDGNFLIRARVIPPANLGEEFEMSAVAAAAPQGQTIDNVHQTTALQPVSSARKVGSSADVNEAEHAEAGEVAPAAKRERPDSSSSSRFGSDERDRTGRPRRKPEAIPSRLNR